MLLLAMSCDSVVDFNWLFLGGGLFRYVPYCTGDTHTGTRTAASPATFGLHFDGHLNFARILDELTANYGTIRENLQLGITFVAWGEGGGG